MQNFLFRLGTAVTIQLIGVFGIFFAFGILLSALQRLTHRRYAQTLGWRGILWTAWIGTPIHELGHVFFAKLFRHNINRVALFQPNPETGNLGSVDHSYNPKSLYQRIGNFFVGAAPLIFGAAFLTALLWLLVPNGKEVFNNPFAFFAEENLRAWNFWLFLYISFSIVSHMAPSGRDLRGMWRGFFWIVLMLIFANAIAFLFGRDVSAFILRVNRYTGIILAMFIYALLLSLLHFLAATILLFPLKKR